MLRILNYVLRHKKLLIIGTFCMLTVIGIDQVSPLLQMALVDKVIGNHESWLFPLIMSAMMIMTLTKAVFGFITVKVEMIFGQLYGKLSDQKAEINTTA